MSPRAKKKSASITDMGLTGWDQFSVAALKQYDPSIPFKLIHVERANKQPLNGTHQGSPLGSQGVGANLPLQIERHGGEFRRRGNQRRSGPTQHRWPEQRAKTHTIPPRGESRCEFSDAVDSAGSALGPRSHSRKTASPATPRPISRLEAQDKLKILVVDGDPQTSLVQSETFFLVRALNPAGEQDSSICLPTVIIAEGLNTAALESLPSRDPLQRRRLFPTRCFRKLQNYVRPRRRFVHLRRRRVQFGKL